MTPKEKAVMEAARSAVAKDSIYNWQRLVEAVIALNNAPDVAPMVPELERAARNILETYLEKYPLSKDPDTMCLHDLVYHVTGSLERAIGVPEAEVRRREREAFVAGVHECWTGDGWTEGRRSWSVEQAFKRYPDPAPTAHPDDKPKEPEPPEWELDSCPLGGVLPGMGWEPWRSFQCRSTDEVWIIWKRRKP